jgi:hypothetical protein
MGWRRAPSTWALDAMAIGGKCRVAGKETRQGEVLRGREGRSVHGRQDARRWTPVDLGKRRPTPWWLREARDHGGGEESSCWFSMEGERRPAAVVGEERGELGMAAPCAMLHWRRQQGRRSTPWRAPAHRGGKDPCTERRGEEGRWAEEMGAESLGAMAGSAMERVARWWLLLP